MKIKKLLAGVLLSVFTFTLLAGCGSSGTGNAADKEASIPEVWTAISDKIGADNLSATMELTADNLKDLYSIDSADLKQFAAYMPMMNVKAEEFFLAEAADGKADAIVSAIESRQKMLDEQWAQYLPDQYELVKNYKLVQNGNYILFAVSENADTAVTVFDEMTK